MRVHFVTSAFRSVLAEVGKLTPLLNEQHFSGADIEDGHDTVTSGALGRIVIEL